MSRVGQIYIPFALSLSKGRSWFDKLTTNSGSAFYQLFHFTVTPFSGVLEKFQPGGSIEMEIAYFEFPVLRLPLFGYPGPLPEQKGPFRMGHYCQMSAIRRTKGVNSQGRTVGVETIFSSGLSTVVNIGDGCQSLPPCLGKDFGVGTM